MKLTIISTAFIFSAAFSFGQGLVKIGDKTPKYYFDKLVNAPGTTIDISDLKGKPTILAFWGTWCAPCIPEMINLGKLQKIFGDKVQIIGVSNDNEQKLKTFLQKRPSKIWFASDPSNNLWNIFDLQTAGHAVLIDKNNYVVSITEMVKIDSAVINNLIIANQLNLSENRGTKLLSEDQNPVNLDSTTIYSFVLQPALKGITPMMKKPRIGTFGNRRITIINLVPAIILKDAYEISTTRKIIYPTKEDSLESNQNSYCIDFIVAENDKANLKALFQKELNDHLPVKGEVQKRTIPCYVLKLIEGKQISIKESTKSYNRFSSSGLEFSGEGIPIKTFISYIENELRYPIYDATGLTKYYDIEFFKNNVDRLQSTKDSLAKLGLELVKDQKEIDVLVITIR
ncbi:MULTISPECIES: redoxin family protein [Niastella]|uniref:Redoxin family protein n=1 Tax=Niastella soli TaxID=2821487 RepID=A0ABS3Z1K2_9BACT|nr:redoxin family protein [Niastella soli]MBO9203994.1 redoxin family protein [Niastella soli]